MSVYIIDKCERFVSQRAGCGKAASPDSVRGVRPQGVRLLDTENASPDSVRGVRPQGVHLLDIENNRNWLQCSTWNWLQERKR